MNQILILGLLWFALFGGICAVLAQNKKLSVPLWFLIGGVLGIIGLVLVLVVPAPAAAPASAGTTTRPKADATQICAHCQTRVGLGWRHCPNCKQPLPELKSWDQAVNAPDEVEKWAQQNAQS
jgi:hypothetical protein